MIWEAEYGALLDTLMIVAAAISALFTGLVADAIGPKKTMLLNTLSFVIGSSFQASSSGSYWPLAVGRFINGFGTWVGCASVS